MLNESYFPLQAINAFLINFSKGGVIVLPVHCGKVCFGSSFKENITELLPHHFKPKKAAGWGVGGIILLVPSIEPNRHSH
jgi:hypothetical protein